MPTFDCLGDPVRRRILGARIDGERAAGEVGGVWQGEFGISQSPASRSARGAARPRAGDRLAPQHPTRETRTLTPLNTIGPGGRRLFTGSVGVGPVCRPPSLA